MPGRAEKEGKVVLQTYTPNNYVYRFASNYDYLGFYKKEANLREVSSFPPFAKIVRILIVSMEKDEALSTTSRLYQQISDFILLHSEEFLYSKAMASPVSKIENKSRFQIILRFKLDKEKEIIDYLYDLIENDKHNKCSIFVEINPSNMS